MPSGPRAGPRGCSGRPGALTSGPQVWGPTPGWGAGEEEGLEGEGERPALMTADSALWAGRPARATDSCRGAAVTGEGCLRSPTAHARAPRREGAGRRDARRARVRGPAGAVLARAPRGQAGNESNHGNPPEEVYSAGDVNPLSPELGQPDFPFSHSNRYQLSVQGGRLRGCSPAGGRTKGQGERARRRALKTQGRFPAGGPGGAPQLRLGPLGARPLTWRHPARAGPRPLTRTCCARARPPAGPRALPSPGPASPLSAHLLRSPPSWDAAHLSFVRGGTIRSGQLSSSGSARVPGAVPSLIWVILPDLCGASAVPRPGAAGGHLPRVTRLEPPSRAPLNHQTTAPPLASTSVIAPRASQPPRETINTGGWHRGALTVCQAFAASFQVPSSRGRIATPILQVRKLRDRKLKGLAHRHGE